MNEKIRIIIADDHPVFIQGLVSILQEEKSIEIIGQASDGKMALSLIQKFRPDIAVLDIQMPEPDGFQIAETLNLQSIPTKVIFLTMFREESLIKKVFDLGVMGYVLKENAITEIIQSVKTVYAGETFVSPQIASILLKIKSKQDLVRDFLTKAERRILKLIAQEKSTKEIAESLYISYKTVENHRSNISKKLGLTGHSALTIYAIKHKDDF
jgi:DNA-binding NarL/FixJ family response regulator